MPPSDPPNPLHVCNQTRHDGRRCLREFSRTRSYRRHLAARHGLRMSIRRGPAGRASEEFFVMPAFQAEYRRRQEAVRQGGRSAERRALRAEYIDFCTRHGLDSGLTGERPSMSSGQPTAGSRSVDTAVSLPQSSSLSSSLLSSPSTSRQRGSVPLHRQPSVPCPVDPPARPGHVDTTLPPATDTSRGPPRTCEPEGPRCRPNHRRPASPVVRLTRLEEEGIHPQFPPRCQSIRVGGVPAGYESPSGSGSTTSVPSTGRDFDDILFDSDPDNRPWSDLLYLPDLSDLGTPDFNMSSPEDWELELLSLDSSEGPTYDIQSHQRQTVDIPFDEAATIYVHRVPSPEAGDYGGVAPGEVSCPLLDTVLGAAADPTLDTVRETPLRAGPDAGVPGIAPGEEPPLASAPVPASEATDPPRAPDSSSTWDPPPIGLRDVPQD